MKKILSAILVLCLSFLCLFGCVDIEGDLTEPNETTVDAPTTAEEPISHGTSGEFGYIEYSDHIMLAAYSGNSARVTIPSLINNKPVTDLGLAFNNNATMKVVVLPMYLKVVNENAFFNCCFLKEVYFPKGAECEKIEALAFSSCQALSMVSLAFNVEVIEDDAFKYCPLFEIFAKGGTASAKAAQKYVANHKNAFFTDTDTLTTAPPATTVK